MIYNEAEKWAVKKTREEVGCDRNVNVEMNVCGWNHKAGQNKIWKKLTEIFKKLEESKF